MRRPISTDFLLFFEGFFPRQAIAESVPTFPSRDDENNLVSASFVTLKVEIARGE
jgi:hypothetical protein